MWKMVLKREWLSNVKKTLDYARADRLYPCDLSRQLCNVKKTWDRLCSPHISKQLCTSVSPKQPNNKVWFLYLNMRNRLCRLNIRDFCENQGSSKYELVHDYYPGYPRNTVPTQMKSVTVGSKVYMWGGTSVSNEVNMNVYSFHPYEDPPFRLCKGPMSRFISPEIHDIYSDIRVLSIEEKIYVLDLPLIRVFDPVHQSWNDILPPHPICLPDIKPHLYDHFVCGYKLFISRTNFPISITDFDTTQAGGTYIFDTRQEKWEDAKNTLGEDSMKRLRIPDLGHGDVMSRYMTSAIEFEGFVIAVTSYTSVNDNRVIAYKLDSNGIPDPKSYQVLYEIKQNFANRGMNHLGKCDDGLVWLVAYIGCGSYDRMHNRTEITVFQVSVSNDVEGNQTLSLEIVAEAEPKFGPSNYCSSAFALCHHADNMELH